MIRTDFLLENYFLIKSYCKGKTYLTFLNLEKNEKAFKQIRKILNK